MLNKLKRKFVLINMCLVGVVMLVVFFVSCWNTCEQAREEIDRAMNMALDDAGKMRKEPFEIGITSGEEMQDAPIKPFDIGLEGKPFNYAAVVLFVSEENGEKTITMQKIANASMNESVTSAAVEAVMNSSENNGKLGDMKLFYTKREEAGGIRIAFADATYFDAKVKKSIVTSVTLFALGMTALLLISLLLANIAVAPVKKAWIQQKRFIADASHELKTPLTVMLANNEILMESAPDDMKKWLVSSKEEANHMKELVDGLLFLAKTDETLDRDGKTIGRSQMETVDLSEVVTGVTLQMEPVMFEAGATLKVDIEDKISMKCESTQMKQLVHILLDNAVKYCGDEGRISLSLSKSNNKIQMRVTNSGEVIPKEDLEHIFERFYRSDRARTGDGHGLGLSIAKTIVEAHAGEITASSDETRGTVMTVNFNN